MRRVYIARYRLWLALMAAVLGTTAVAAGITVGQVADDRPGPEVLVQEEVPSVARPISLTEAWDMAETRAREWQQDAALVQLNSADVNEDTAQSGIDGKRRSWQVITSRSGSPGGQLWIQITDGVIASTLERSGASELPPLEKPVVDSPDAVAVALGAKLGFGVGADKTRGVHFALETDPDTGASIIHVRGSLGGRPAFVKIDASTGRILGGQRLTYGTTGGVLYSADAGVTWHASNLTGRTITSVTPAPDFGGVGYASGAQESGIVIYRTADGGATWTEAGRLPASAGEWPFAIAAFKINTEETALLVGTHAGLWVSRDSGVNWSKISGLPDGPVSGVAVAGSGSAFQILANVNVDGPIAALYSSADLISWKKEAHGAFRLSRSADGETVLAIDESGSNKGRMFGRGAPVIELPSRTPPTATTPETVLRAAGSFDGSAPIVAEAPDRIEFSDDGGASWRITLEENLASLAAAPDFASSGVAVAGGFRTGIYRSDNGGRTWAIAVDAPNSIVSGSGEIAAVTFLSSKSVVAVNGGALVWEDF